MSYSPDYITLFPSQEGSCFLSVVHLLLIVSLANFHNILSLTLSQTSHMKLHQLLYNHENAHLLQYQSCTSPSKYPITHLIDILIT